MNLLNFLSENTICQLLLDYIDIDLDLRNLSLTCKTLRKQVPKNITNLQLTIFQKVPILQHLRKLNVAGKTNIHIPYLPKLNKLNCSKTYLRELSIYNCHNLIYLNCSYNRLTHLPEMPNLTYLDCRGGDKLVLSKMPKIKTLISGFAYFDLNDYPNLEELTCTGILDLNIPDKLINLKHLECKNCIFIDPFPSSLTKIQVMNLENCKNIKIYETFINLEYLTLNDCSDVSLSEYLPNLKYLSLEETTEILSISPHYINLEELNIKGTGINYIPKSFLTKLVRIDKDEEDGDKEYFTEPDSVDEEESDEE